jgi:hypothetical protein
MHTTITPELTQAFQSAIDQPEAADLTALWQQIEREIACLPSALQLRVAGAAIDQLAGIWLTRAKYLLGTLEEPQAPTEPIFDSSLLGGLVQQSQSLNLDNLIQPAPPERRQRPSGSIVGAVEKSQLLAALTSLVDSVQVAHSENVGEWSEAIARFMENTQGPIALSELQQSLGLSLIEVWLGLLLSGSSYQLEQQGDFYGGEVWIHPHKTTVNLA